MLELQPVEYAAELGRNPLGHLFRRDWVAAVVAQQASQRSDSPVVDAAGDDQVEIAEVGRGVEGEAVAGNPARDADANRRELVAFIGPDPDASEPFHAPRVHAVTRRGPNQHFFQVAHVAVDVAAIRLQVDDWIADDLARSVVRDVTAAPGFVHLDTATRERLAGGEDVGPPAVSTHAKRQDVRMFKDQQRVADASRTSILDERALQGERLGIWHAAQPPDL